MALISDISVQKELEMQIAQSQKIQAIGTLAAGVAHEINTPAQFVRDNLSFLKESIADFLKANEALTALFEAIKAGNGVETTLNSTTQVLEEVEIGYLLEELPNAINESLEGIDRVAEIVRAMKAFAHPGSADRQLKKSVADLVKAYRSLEQR